MRLKKNQILGLIAFGALILFWIEFPFIQGKYFASLALLLLGVYLMIK